MGYLVLAVSLLMSVALAAASYFGLKTTYQPALLALAVLSSCTLLLSAGFSVYVEILRRRAAWLQTENHKLALLLEHGSSAMLLLNNDFVPEYINYRHPTLEKLNAEHSGDLINIQKWKKYLAPETRQRIREAITDGVVWQGELRFDNSERDHYLSTIVSPVLNQAGELNKIVVCCEDISEHKAIADRLFIREHYNVLTGLPNRQFALRSLHAAIDECSAQQQKFILIYIDLDRIRYINESLGHHVVDKILIETAERLRRSVRDEHILAHLGADEFLIILDAGSCHDEASIQVDSLLDRCRAPFYIEQHEVTISASIGLSQYPEDGVDANTLMRRAEAAMFDAKNQGGDRFSFYNENMSDLGQPGPDEFILIAEHSGQIVTIGNWVLEQACQQIMTWSRAGFPALNVAVNISSKQFIDGDILASVDHALKQSGLPAAQLELEITEGLLLNDTPAIRDIFKQLKKFGVHLSLDDFGTGYASLSYLKRYPFDTLKIDRSFVKDIDNCQDSITLTNAIIAMAHSFGMRVIAEGVENLNQRRILRERHCDMVQGYLYSPALAADDFLDWAKRYSEMQHSKHV